MNVVDKLIHLCMVFMIITVTCLFITPTRTQTSTVGCAPDIGKRTPVVLVHGFLSQPSTWDQMVQTIKNDVPSVYTEAFDYSSAHTDWVDNPAIGPKLAQTITCLATSSKQAGGLGKVIVIAHSMGGLATRFAATEAPNAAEVARDLGIVITIGTPNIGSGWGNFGVTIRPAACTPELVLGQAPKVPANSLCASEALSGLRNYSKQIEALPWLPSSVPLLAIAGDVSVTYSLFTIKLKLDTKADLFVSEKSAIQGTAHLDKGGGQAIIPCGITIQSFGLLVDEVASIAGSLSCWHSALTHNQAVELATVNAIKRYLASIELASYIGQWGHHDYGLTINTDGTGMDHDYFGFTPECGDTPANRYGTLTFTPESGYAVGVYTSVTYDSCLPSSFHDRHVGDSFKLTPESYDRLLLTWIGNPPSGNDPTLWLCGPNTPLDVNINGVCGA